MNIGEIIFKETMKEHTQKYKEYNTLEEYLNSYTRKDLYKLALRYGLINSDNKLAEVLIANTSTKNKMLEYVLNNIETIIKSELLTLNDIDIEFLKKILDNNNITIEDRKVPISLVTNLGDTPIIHIYYDKKKDIVTINIQKDIAAIINKVLKNKSFLEEHKKILDFENNIEMLLEVYGIIEENNLYNIYTKVFKNIDEKEFNRYLISLYMKDCVIRKVEINNIKYVSILELDDYEASSYLAARKGEYEIYPKEFYINIENRTYLKSLKSYENLYDYFLKYYGFDLNKENDIFELIVCDYLYQIQESKQVARDAILTNLDQYFNINSKQKNEIINYLNKIYYDYPKWRKKGNI